MEIIRENSKVLDCLSAVIDQSYWSHPVLWVTTLACARCVICVLVAVVKMPARDSDHVLVSTVTKYRWFHSLEYGSRDSKHAPFRTYFNFRWLVLGVIGLGTKFEVPSFIPISKYKKVIPKLARFSDSDQAPFGWIIHRLSTSFTSCSPAL